MLAVVAMVIGSGIALSACSSHAKTHPKAPFVFIPGRTRSSSPKTTSPPTSTTPTKPTATLPPTTTSSSQGPLYGTPLLNHLPLTMDGLIIRGADGVTATGKTVLLVLSKLPYAKAEAAWTAVCAFYHDPCTEYQPVFRGGNEIG